MKPRALNSRHNPILKEYRKLLANRNYRRKKERIAVEGPNLVREALQAGLIPEFVFITESFYNNEIKWFADLPHLTQKIVLPPLLFKEISETESPQEIAAIFPFVFKSTKIEINSISGLVVIADRLQDPGNMGSLIRTAVAAGVDLLYCTEGSTDPYGPKVLRSTAGSIFKIGIQEVSGPEQLLTRLKEEGYSVVAAAGIGEHPYWSLTYNRPVALVVGNEASGVADKILSLADMVAAIPMHGNIESLNAAVAAGIILYEIRRQESAGST